ncbi:N-acetylneuraminate synthase family protein [Sphingomonas sp.]|jgi:N-acetylneuraminate synthase|uniref:N-acetylneuraminate synthase family protein n=1 Tax=Sphingomonas sp. TaxID=28214 RepID=UPI002DEEEBE2|nr:N-acetylneuraminate synthase family protein [Sphingomonas sp.]HEV2568130.1 N-acetylneuraminate synthase family protein [Sphingomonas sp.]
MLIDKNISRYIVFSEDDLVNALRKISSNKARVVFCVSGSGQLEGVLTDGDVRRWLTREEDLSLDVTALTVANKDFVSAPIDSASAEIESRLSDRIGFIPLVDRHNHLVAIAWRQRAEVSIGHLVLDEESPAFIIAEIGNNHNGSLDLAKRLIDLAADAGADCAKFQMRNMAKLYRNAGDANDTSADLGAQYTLDLLSRFQLSDDELVEAFDHCKDRRIIPLCTPWDHESLERLEAYGMPAYKLASADLTNHDLLSAMAKTGKTIICSTGMSTENEIKDAVAILQQNSAPFILLHCNSTYPAPFKDINLRYLERLKRIGGSLVGYSGHERGYAVPLAAVAMGAKLIEKHFTVDRSMEGNDHRVSLLPDEFREMVVRIREVEESLGNAGERRLTQGEMMNREVLAKSLVAAVPIARGTILSDDMLSVRSPGQGLQPYYRKQLIGRPAPRDLAEGDFFYPSDLQEAAYGARHFTFRRPFGLPVRYHDLQKMVDATNLDLVEFHLSYKDMEEPVERHLGDRVYDLDLVVHSPELFAGDHIMDLCAPDPAYRARSIAELNRVAELTRQLKPHFARAQRPMIIINAGGFSLDRPIPAQSRLPMYEMIADALRQVDQEGVEIILQTMPPFPWHFGGQRYHNLFMSADDIVRFSAEHGYRVCLDLSHSQLACTHEGESFSQFLEQVAPLTGHLHVVDAEGVDGEGLQIGEGTMDFAMVAEILDRRAPQASFIPEIWQGHKNDGAGFWEALAKLERWF